MTTPTTTTAVTKQITSTTLTISEKERFVMLLPKPIKRIKNQPLDLAMPWEAAFVLFAIPLL